MVDLGKFQKWLKKREGEHLEFKEAKSRYSFEDLMRYAVALANEGGGKIILGATDKLPRIVVGTRAFLELEKTLGAMIQRIHLKIEAESFEYKGKRVVLFNIPSRPIGVPIQYKGCYWMRGGDSVLPMTTDVLQNIFAEAQPDFSAEICPKTSLKNLDPKALSIFRNLWYKKSQNKRILQGSDKQLLEDIELLGKGGVTYAALILFGTAKALNRFLPQSEVIFEYRLKESSIHYDQRKELRRGFFTFFNELWELINLRNELQHYRKNLFIWDIPSLNEEVVREILLNAISHRDYRLPGSIFVKQFPQKLEIISPGGFPPGINTENILYRQFPRNRRIAETFARCGLVERAGQGFDKIYSQCILESKLLPNFDQTDNYQVDLTLDGNIQDPAFLLFLEKIRQETSLDFSLQDLLVMDFINRQQRIHPHLVERIKPLLEAGIIEKIGKTRGTKYLLSKRFYDFTKKRATYTRKRGLDREQKKTLLLQHLKNYGKGTFGEFQEVLPNLTPMEIKSLIRDLKKSGAIIFRGSSRKGFWELIIQLVIFFHLFCF